MANKLLLSGRKVEERGVEKWDKIRNIEPAKFSADNHTSDVTWLTTQRKVLASVNSFENVWFRRF